MTKMYVTYATRNAGSNDDFRILPNAVPIEGKPGRIKENFLRVFNKCFGNDLEVRVIGISAEKELTSTD